MTGHLFACDGVAPIPLPALPLRQWVIRFSSRCASFSSRPDALARALAVIYRLIATHLAHKAGFTRKEAATGAVTLVQKHEKQSSYGIASVFSYRNEPDRAFEGLDKAVAYQDPGFAEIVLELQFANIRNDPRWLPFLRKIGKAPEQLAAIKLDVKVPQQ
jgi:hypothetical protein